MADLKPYRVTLSSGFVTTLMLSSQKQKRDYPDAVEVKVGAPEFKDAPKRQRRKPTAEKQD